MKIDINKKYTTRQGWEVELFTDKASGEFPIVGQMLHPDSGWTLIKWNLSGAWAIGQEGHPNDLIEVKEKIKLTGFLNVYKSSRHQAHKDKMDADCNASSDRIARLDLSKYNIEFEIGEGLNE